MADKRKKRTMWNIDKVKYFVEVESDSGCLLTSKEYINLKSKLEFICSCGESFSRNFTHFKEYKMFKCKKCTGIIEWDIKKVKKYIESTSDCILVSKAYKNSRLPLEILCGCRRKIFKRSFKEFRLQKQQGCNLCTLWQIWTFREVKEYVEVYSASGCLLLSDKYLDAMSDLVFLCKCGNRFSRSFNSFKNQEYHNCNDCRYNKSSQKRAMTQEEFEKRVYNLEEDNYTVLGRYTNSCNKIKIKCNKCSHIWSPTPNDFLSGGRRCPKCAINSKGEREIERILARKEIYYYEQKKFEECKNQGKLPFDFYVDNRVLVEYDGDDHFRIVKRSKSNDINIKRFIKRKSNDKIKNQYCIDNNIPLIRIPYWEFDNIEPILTSALSYYNLLNSEEEYDKELFKEFLVDENWVHDDYIAKCPKNEKKLEEENK